MNSTPRTYLDWNASAPLRPEARAALLEALERFGNPASPHSEGRAARDLLESSREDVASFMGCEPAEVVFTSGGTEANALAVASLVELASTRSFAAARVEHPSVLRPLDALVGRGWKPTWLQVASDGRVSPVFDGRSEIGFGCLQAGNHETGALQPVAELGEAWSAAGVRWHCDAVQAWGRVSLPPGVAGATTASLSGHKLGGPKGVGALYVRAGTPIQPLLRGGPQERGRRAGTENLPGIAALAAACRAAASDFEEDRGWMGSLRDRSIAGVKELEPLAWVNGPEEEGARLPNTVNFSLPGFEADFLVQALDLAGIAVSAGSACTSGALEPSEVLASMGVPEWRLRSAVRVSVGPATRADDVDRFLAAVGRILESRRSSRVP